MFLWRTRSEAEKALADGQGCQMHHGPGDRGRDPQVVEADEGEYSICCDNPDCIEDMLLK